MELDYAILADAAVSKDGYMHIICGGVSNFNVPQIPAPINAALAINFTASRLDMQRPHKVEVRFIDQDGNLIPDIQPLDMQVAGDPNPPMMPVAGLPYNCSIVMYLQQAVVNRVGLFAIDVLLDGRSVKRIPFSINLIAPLRRTA